MKGKIFTPEEASRMIPLVRRIADDIVVAYRNVNAALQAFETAKTRADEAEGAESIRADQELRRADERVARELDRFQSLIEEIESLGGTVKDYESGAIDFYGDVDGEIVYLSWQRGEDHVQYWHRLEDGLSDRRLLPLASGASH